MAPARKKSKLANDNEPDEPRQSDVPAAQEDDAPDTSTVQPPEGTPSSPTRPNNHNRGSWYSASSWKSKAGPVAQVARESIQVDRGVSSESSSLVNNHENDAKRRSSQSVSKSVRGSSRKSIPLIAEPTRVHATSDVSQPPKQQQKKPVESSEKVKESAGPEERKEVEDVPLPPEPTAMGEGEGKDDAASIRPASGTWFGWWSRPDGYGSDGEKAKSSVKVNLDVAAEEASGTPLPRSPNEGQLEVPKDGTEAGQNAANGAEDPSAQLRPEMSMNTGSTRSWFGLWSSTQNQQAEQEGQQIKDNEEVQQTEQLPVSDTKATAEPAETAKDMKTADPSKANDNTEVERPKSSGWAFWSKETPKEAGPQQDGTQKDVGEIAVADTPSQSHPEAAQFNTEPDQRKQAKPELKRNSSLLRPKRGRPEKPKDLSGETTAAATPVGSELPTPSASQFQTPAETPEASPAPAQRGKKPLQARPNLILPKFREVYPPAPNPGYLERLAQYFAQTLHIPGYAALPPPQHPFITKYPPKVKKAIAIGVHGFFPAQLFQRVLGQPTGTSIRFANYAAASIKQWCQDHQPDVKDVEVEKVALEGEGIIADRVNTLWKLLLNWLSHLRQADFILVACHSQGVPVAIMLVAKLIQLGALSPHVRIGVCAMAGINLGPFLEYKSRLFGGSALELFDFCDSKSKVSVAYAESLDICLRQGVRVTFCGSIDDQLVSLESSLHAPLTHPYVNRIVFIDGRLHTSNFLSHLIVFAVKLRNLCVSDHGLLREISAPVAGSLVGGEGHSRVYDDPAVYQTAVEFALESTEISPALYIPPTNADEKRKSMEAATQRRASLGGFPTNMNAANHMRRGSLSSLSLAPPGIGPSIAAYEAPGAMGVDKNPFVLPWAVRGMLEEDIVRRDAKMQEEVKELVKEFESWRPNSKVLKDVRWRLEGVRSML
ncbi:hypothetical protein M409DRAFT_69764 [Zasmidium cellare ATCC 36951]|uniref:YMC020W-like alpha/beta hydrolase domain-containing protein n=1 Tax=Zasmidium cellare ATCC 36951 TaxID=1080233 RepID=A0A6A6C7N8_ZASCE|nr:uncharacterized protein M409DRAFT_69764 [Zasmidium cellare ATCC 36951]KAF2161406.1 hypothetical protein M409DRAFT_69764 [Zasmidium cellare ATCC 36951]